MVMVGFMGLGFPISYPLPCLWILLGSQWFRKLKSAQVELVDRKQALQSCCCGGCSLAAQQIVRECLHVFPTFHYYLSINMRGVNKQLDVKPLLRETSWVSTWCCCTQFCLNKGFFRHLRIARRHMQHPTKRLRSHYYNIVNHPITIQIQNSTTCVSVALLK